MTDIAPPNRPQSHDAASKHECGAETLPGEPPIHNRTCSHRVPSHVCLCNTTEEGWRPCPPSLCERPDHEHEKGIAMSDATEATVYVNGTMKTQPITVDHVMDGTTAYGRIWIDHHLSIELSKQNLARLIEDLSELEL